MGARIGIRSFHALVALILFILSMNIYLLTASTGNYPFNNYTLNVNDLRLWFGLNCIILIASMIVSFYVGLTEKLQINCFILSLISIAIFQLFVTLNSIGLTPNPYLYLICFDMAALLTILVLSKYGHYSVGD